MSTRTSQWSNSSVDESAFGGLSAEQRERLSALLERYLTALEQDKPLDQEVLIEENPDLADSLLAYFRSIDDLHAVAAGFHAGSSSELPAETEVDQASRIGDFRLIREIGRGGMGVVYEARQISLDRRVALKVLPFAAVLDSKQIARFKNEAQAAAQLQHPHIVPVFAIGAERGVHYYAMQFIDGYPLNRAIEEMRQRPVRGRRSASQSRHDAPSIGRGDTNLTSDPNRQSAIDTVIEEDLKSTEQSPSFTSALTRHTRRGTAYFQTVMRLGIQIADALHAAHEYGVVHRDIKPSNLLLDKDGKVWVTDFGLARFRLDASLTKTGDVVGTMQYMSPEQASGLSALVDQRTDIYSLAATLYELLTWQAPYAGHDAQVIFSRKMSVEPPSLRSIRTDIPADLETVIQKAMARSRDERYASASEFAEDLRRVLDGKPTMARPPTISDRMRKWARQHRRIVGLAASLCLMALAGLSVAVLMVTTEKQRAEKNYVRAEQYFQHAKGTVDRFGANFAERLADVPAAAHIRRDLLRETLQYYQSFAERAQDDPQLRAELALTYSKMATLAEQIGSVDESLTAHEHAVRLFRRLVADAPGDVTQQSRLGQSYNNYALTLQRAGDIEKAHEAFSDGIRWQTRLVSRNPQVHEFVADLARTHTNFGLLHSQTNRRDKAEESFQAAIQLQQKLIDAQPNETEHRRGLAASYHNLASLFVVKRPRDAAQYYEQALRLESAAAEARPENLRFRANVAATCNDLGALHARQGDHAPAAAKYQDAVRIQTELVRLAPSQKSYKHDLAVSYNNFGTAQMHAGQLALAESSVRKSLEYQQPLVDLDPEDVALQCSLGGMHNNLGMILEKADRTEEAAQAFQQAIVHQKRAHDRAPDVARYRIFLNKHYYNYGRVMRALGRIETAIQAALDRRELWPNNAQRLVSVAEEFSMAIQADIGLEFAARSRDLAFATLEMARIAGMTSLELQDNQAFEMLRTDPRYASLFTNSPLPPGEVASSRAGEGTR